MVGLLLVGGVGYCVWFFGLELDDLHDTYIIYIYIYLFICLFYATFGLGLRLLL